MSIWPTKFEHKQTAVKQAAAIEAHATLHKLRRDQSLGPPHSAQEGHTPMSGDFDM